MNNVYEYDTKMINHQFEERRLQLARTYADGQSDSAAIRLMLARSAGSLGDALLKISEVLGAGRVNERHQDLRVRTDNGT